MATTTTATTVNNSVPVPASPKSLPASPLSPSRISFDNSIASILAESQHRRQHHQSTDDTPLVAPSAAPRPRIRDRGKSTNALLRPSDPSTKKLPPLPSTADTPATARPKTSPSPSSPATPASPSPLPASGDAASRTSTSSRQRASTTAEPLRSPPLNKRAPASRSCHGVETSSGPPPALSLRPALATANTGGAVDVRRKPTPPAWAHTGEQNATTALDTEEPGTQARLTPSALAQLEALVQKNADTARNLSRAQSRGRRLIRDSDGGTVPTADDATRSRNGGGVLESESSNLTPKPMRVEVDMSGETTRAREDLTGDSTQGSRRSQSSGEDLFLTLARDDDAEAAVAENAAARRRSKVGTPAHRQTQSSSAALDAVDRQSEHTIQAAPNRSRPRRPSLQSVEYGEVRTPSSNDRFPARDRKYPASAHPLEQRATSRVSGGFSRSGFAQARALCKREMSPESPSVQGSSRTSGPTSQIYAPRSASRQQPTVNGHYHSSPAATRNNQYDQEPSPPLGNQGTESTISTTAPSTLWDEVQDLKSRLRTIETMGMVPQSSGAGGGGTANTNGDRPRTATTTVTTMSSSPKRARGDSSSPVTSSAGVEDSSSPHALLSQALAKSKAFVSPEAYQALDTVATDALTISKMTHSATSKPPPSSANGTPSAIDRQLRRKADALCRSLTELCIALANVPAPQSQDQDSTLTQNNRRSIIALRPASRDAPSGGNDAASTAAANRFSRGRSLEPEGQQTTPPPSASARALSRLEARRTSLRASESPMARSPVTANYSPAESGATSATATPGGQHVRDAAPTPTQSTVSRTSTVLGRIHRHALAAAADGQHPGPAFEQHLHSSLPSPDDRGSALAPAGRPISRAATDLGRARSTVAASRRQSREYYSQHPLPERGPGESLLQTPRLHQQLQQPQTHPQQQQRYSTQTPATGQRRSYLSRASPGPSGLVQPRTYIEQADGSPVTVVPVRSSTTGARPSRLASMGAYGVGGETRSLVGRPERRSIGLTGSILRNSRRESVVENGE